VVETEPVLEPAPEPEPELETPAPVIEEIMPEETEPVVDEIEAVPAESVPAAAIESFSPNGTYQATSVPQITVEGEIDESNEVVLAPFISPDAEPKRDTEPDVIVVKSPEAEPEEPEPAPKPAPPAEIHNESDPNAPVPM
jgi:hypothetical protein